MPPNVSTPDADLELLSGFVNTRDLLNDRDAIAAPADLAAWLREHGLAAGTPTAEQHRRALALREALRGLLLAKASGTTDAEAARALSRAAATSPFLVTAQPDGDVELVPAGTGVDAALGRLLAIVVRARADGRWERMKACAADDCRWAFYDRSRNRSRTWCDMSECGNREKARAYRARHRRVEATG